MSTSHRFDGLFRLGTGVLLAVACCPLFAATSVSQFGITWTFNADYPVGQYANGDFYVVAPSGLTITGISPGCLVVPSRVTSTGGNVTNSIVNGSMINPIAGGGASHGFDSTIVGYDPALNVGRPGGNDLSPSNPLVLAAGTSLISSISNITAGIRPGLTDAAVLTIVTAPPAAGSFRPPYCGSDKSHNWNKANLSYAILRKLNYPLTGVLNLVGADTPIQRPWLEINTQSPGRYIHPSNNQPDYGGNMSLILGPRLLLLHLNVPNTEKEMLYIRLVQYGLDIYGAAKNGGNWAANGGHNLGRKMPLVLAGLAFNDANILAYANAATHFIFQEDQQTFVVDNAQLLVVPYTADGRPRQPYTAEMIGTPEWGEKHASNKTRDASNWSAYYRDLCYQAMMDHVLMAQLTPGAKTAWNWQVFFDYYDRAKSIAPASDFPAFGHAMWTNYRALGGTPFTVMTTLEPSNAKVSISVQ